MSLPFHPELLFLSVEGAQTAAYQLKQNNFIINTPSPALGSVRAHCSEKQAGTDVNLVYTTLNLPLKGAALHYQLTV